MPPVFSTEKATEKRRTTVKIRKATKYDIEAVATIYKHIHSSEREGKTHTGWIEGVYPTEETAKTGVERGDLFVYEDDGKILASARINKEQMDIYSRAEWKYPAKDENVLVIHTLRVEPLYAGSGIGSELMRFYEKLAAETGCTALRLDTGEKNTAARLFYKKHGYREAGAEACDFNGIPGIVLVMLEKKV